MIDDIHILEATPGHRKRTPLEHYRAIPLYLRILIAMGVGLAIGLLLGDRAEPLKWISRVILKILGALAPALIFVAVMDAILGAKVGGRSTAKMAFLLILNTVVAIFIGLTVANIVQPGTHENLQPDAKLEAPKTQELGEQLLDNIPKSVLEPLVDNNVIGVVFIAVAFGIAFRRLAKTNDIGIVNQFISLAFKAIVVILHWVLDFVPLAVFCTVAETVGTNGIAPLVKLGWFVVAVLLALSLQTLWYLIRIRFGSWVRPMPLLAGMRDALVMAFSTSSSTATMPVTYACLREKVGLREDSASMGALVGTNFNNDGTALYEAMAALFIAQMIGTQLSLGQQLVVVLMAIVASVGAAGIPEAGLVTMTLVFTAVRLPKEYIFLLLPVDWFLDRCRTAINVLGDVNVACLLEGKQKSNSDSSAMND
ncbi:MAG TPA: dicarboxylate/amino acid:cation symporter [Pirellulales bacterium]